MGASVAPVQDPTLRLQYYKETGQTELAAKYEQYLRETGQLGQSGQSSLAPTMTPETGHRGVPFVNAKPEPTPAPSWGEQAAGGVASFLRHVPGGETFQSAGRALTRGGGGHDVARGLAATPMLAGQPVAGFMSALHSLMGSPSYASARDDIRGAEASSGRVGDVNSLIGGGISAMAMPGTNPLTQGGLFGAASGLGQSDPSAGIGRRAKDAAIEGSVDALSGKLLDVFGTGARGLLAKDLGRNALDRKAATAAADKLAYGAAEREGALASRQPTPPAITRALNAPDIAPYAQEIRQSRQFAGADDYTVLRESYKLMSERSGLLKNRMMNANDFKAGTSLDAGDVRLAKRQMLQSADAPITQRPAIVTAQSPHPDLRTAISDFWSRPAIALDRNEGTVAQQMARRGLERHGAESIVSPSLSGEPADVMGSAMPSWPKAVEQHARMAQNTGAFNEGADATKRILSGTKPAAKKLTTRSPAAFAEQIGTLSPADASAAREGALGRLQESMGLNAHVTQGFGIPKSLTNASRISPYINLLDKQSGSAKSDLLRALGITFGGTGYGGARSYFGGQ